MYYCDMIFKEPSKHRFNLAVDSSVQSVDGTGRLVLKWYGLNQVVHNGRRVD